MFIDRIKYAITIKAAFLIFIITLLATIIRPIFIDQDVVFTYIGAANSVVLGAVFLFVKYTKSKPWHPFFFVLIGLMVLTPIALVSGGVNSQFSYLFPIIPVFIALVSSPKFTLGTTVIIVLVIICMLMSLEFMPNYTYESVPVSKSESRALWLCFSVLLSATFGIEFNRINNTLGNKLTQQAEIDMLTGIANRRSAMEYLTRTLNEAKDTGNEMAVMLVDVDHFKLINDKYGHLSGDKCLKSVAHAISSSLREDIDLVGRYGGEEFIVVVKNVTASVAYDIANKIRLTIAQTQVDIGLEEPVGLTATIGVVALKDARLHAVEQCVEKADLALYEGKKQGRNQVVMASDV